MSDAVTELAQKGRALDAKDRERLVDLLLDSLTDSPDPEVEEAWRLEIRRRVAAYERGEAVLHEMDDVLAEAKRLAP
ncbi:MAG TPA: addiction module protein [Burkholderiaceae bacterium]|jgi:putative addiction module component (TIGR02574 family)